MRRTALAGVLLGLGSLAGCGDGGRGAGPGDAGDAEVAALEERLATLRDSLRTRRGGDALLGRIAEQPGDVLLVVRTGLVRDIATWLAGTYLDQVRLHLEPDLVVSHEQEVRPRVGPIRVSAGTWRVDVTIRAIRANLRVGRVELGVADSSLMRAVVTVQSDGGSGETTVDFRWDAAAIPSLLCSDFEARERLAGTVPPARYRVSGILAFEATPEGILAVPDFSESPLRVSPRPTGESWARIRALLREAEDGCGPLDPDDVVTRLEGVLRRGFEFRLPESIFRRVLLPTAIRDRIEVLGKSVRMVVTPSDLRATEAAIWYAARMEAGPP